MSKSRFKAPKNCGNSPKSLRLIEFNRAFIESDHTSILAWITEDVTWTVIGESRISGSKDFMEAIKKMSVENITSYEITSVLTHGKEGAVRGNFQLKDGKNYEFFEKYIFNSAKLSKINSMESFIIESP